MGSGSSVPYRLRPNKAVDRELFLALLARLAPSLSLQDYHYIGMGGPFLEDFRMVHARLGIKRMTSVEMEEDTYKRQIFNRPVALIKCVYSTLEDYLDGETLDTPVIIWFDYTEPRSLVQQILRFAQAFGEVPVRSVLRVTLNANPTALGQPDPNDLSVEIDGDASEDRTRKPTIQEWRLKRFRERVGTLLPADLGADGMTYKTYGLSVLRTLKIAVEKEALSHPDRGAVWALATHYADGQPMVTATLLVTETDNESLVRLVKGWEFYTTPASPHHLDLPALSTLERLSMEASEDRRGVLGFELPKSDMGTDPFDVFELFYRIYPHFSRVYL